MSQTNGAYRYKVGDFEVIVVRDGINRQPLPDGFVVNVPKEEVNKALEEAGQERDFFTGLYNPVVINTRKKLALVDTGMGEAGFAASKGVNGLLKQNLEAIGITLDQIDTVIISHYHGDHVNGLVKPDGSLGYPNAEILVPAVEHKFWMDDGEMSRAANPRMQGLFKNNRRVFSGEVLKRVHTYDWDKEVIPGVTAVGTPGHTVGHTSYLVASRSDKVFVQSDVTNVDYLFVRNPHWHPFYDQDPVQAEATRRRVYDMLVAEKLKVQAFHFPFPACAHVEKAGNGYRTIPAA